MSVFVQGSSGARITRQCDGYFRPQENTNKVPAFAVTLNHSGLGVIFIGRHHDTRASA